MWTLSHFLAGILAAIFATAAIFDLSGTIRARFRQWPYPRQFYRVMGLLQLLTALFLAVPQLRIWGIVLAGLISFFWVCSTTASGAGRSREC
jgi:hypothetical protein